jgi:hypothetical protein
MTGRRVHGAKHRDEGRGVDAPQLAAMGLEAEFGLVIDGESVKVEEVFRDPRDFLGRSLIHRAGTSYHLPTGGAVYFDTGVIEIATPVIEIERGCATRAARSLWESIRLVREGLAAWERRSRRRAALSGFSTHYNISFDGRGGAGRTLEDLAFLLSYVLPCPVMVLATNRRSTGVGVRPRGNRIEVTADFTPSAPLMVASAAAITGVARAVMQWPAFDVGVLREHDVPVIAGYSPMPHTSRRGWLARYDRYPQNPFTTNIDAPVWRVHHVRPEGGDARLSLRAIARRVFDRFRWPIARVADPLTFRLIGAVMSRRAPSLLDLPDRPAAYEDVGRLCSWDRAFAQGVARSRYERVLIRALSGAPLRIGRQILTPLGTRGWSRVVFRRAHDGARQSMTLDALLPYLEGWERGQ